jgi:hypothetical protein
MSEFVTRIQNQNTLVTGYDYSKIFLGSNRTITEEMTAAADLVPGTLMDRVTASGALIAFNSGTAGNNKKPVGVLMSSIANGETKQVTICVAGDVSASKIVLVNVADTLETVIAGQKIKDLINGWANIIPVTVTEISSEDNY